MDITNITDDMIGKKITCYIKDTFIEDGEITYNGKHFFILHNKKDGSEIKDKKGYKYSWIINYYDNLNHNNVTNLKLKIPLTSSIELWI